MMKFKSIKKASITTIFPFILLSLSSCGGGIETPDLDVIEIDDNYRTYYQIFPISFADSDDDGNGDLRGIIDKVDYIKDLGFNAVWLNPIHPSPTYHMYDVTDYYDINPTLGTLDDFDELVSKLHDNNMTIILDLVINHSSSEHEWFIECYQAHIRDRTDSKYYDYYVISEANSASIATGNYHYVPTSSNTLMYEGRFWSGMPDLNLQAVLDDNDSYLANEIRDILKFWLVDHNVDGFRLDAVTSYFSNNISKNAEFLTWLMNEAKAIKEDVYIVAEGAWGTTAENRTYLEAGINSTFLFESSQVGGFIGSTITGERATRYYNGIVNAEEQVVDLDYAVQAPFISNHDVSRLTGATLSSDGNSASYAKFGYGLLQMMSGASFHYYGDEIGMAIVYDTSSTDVGDENRRQPLYWGENDSYTCEPVSGSYTEATTSQKYPYGSVEEQQNDSDSILNFVKKANTVRNQHLAISHGTIGDIYLENDLKSAIAFNKVYGDEDILIVINASFLSSYTIDFGELGYSEVVGVLDTDEYSTLDGTTLTVAPLSIIVIE